MGVALLTRYGNQFKVDFDDGSATLAIQSSTGFYTIGSNDEGAICFTEFGNQALITFNDGSTQLAKPTGTDLYITGLQSVVTPPPPPPAVWGEPMDMSHVVITSPFGWRKNPVGSGQEFHEGTDLSAGGILGRGIVSVTNGTVRETTYISYVGNYIEITSDSDSSVVGYAHMEDSASHYVSVGDKVKIGQTIGRVGSSGESTGAHLELRTRNSNAGPYVDPVGFMAARGVTIP